MGEGGGVAVAGGWVDVAGAAVASCDSRARVVVGRAVAARVGKRSSGWFPQDVNPMPIKANDNHTLLRQLLVCNVSCR